MPRHIGIIGCSAEGAALCYKTLCIQAEGFLGKHAHPEVSMHTHCLAEYVQCLEAGNLQGVATLMLDSGNKLRSIGAEVLICPDNTVHQAFRYFVGRIDVPYLHIAEVVVREAQERGYRRLGLLGTGWLVRSDVYSEKVADRGIECVRPSSNDLDLVNTIIMDELVCGVQRPEALASLQAVIRKFADLRCDAVILGCTELPVLLNDANSSLPTLDSTRLLARAALHFACS